MDETFDVIVIGGGAAGLSGALTLARARRSVLVIDAGEQRNLPAGGVHNFLTREGLAPDELVRLGRADVERYGGSVLDGRVVAVGGADGAFTVALEDGRELGARRLLLATGLVDELLGVPGIREQWGAGVVHCPYCHGYEVRDLPLGVLSTGPQTAHLAQLFRQWSDDVIVFAHTGEPASNEDALAMRARGIRVVEGEVAAIESEDGAITGVRLASGEVVPRRAVVVAPRFVPRVSLLAGIGVAEPLERDVTGRVAPGVWAAGNAGDPMAWVVAALSQGVMAGAAINIDLIGEETRDAVASMEAAAA